MNTRIYLITSNIQLAPEQEVLVEASSAAQALRYATKEAFECRVATTLEVAAIIGNGGKLEKAD
jgi:hypothetical protein